MHEFTKEQQCLASVVFKKVIKQWYSKIEVHDFIKEPRFLASGVNYATKQWYSEIGVQDFTKEP